MGKFPFATRFVSKLAMALVLTVCGTAVADPSPPVGMSWQQSVPDAAVAETTLEVIDASSLVELEAEGRLVLDLRMPLVRYLFEPSQGPIDFSRILVMLPNGHVEPLRQSLAQVVHAPEGSPLVQNERFVMSLSAEGAPEYLPFGGMPDHAVIQASVCQVRCCWFKGMC